jgi:hypothetical protein
VKIIKPESEKPNAAHVKHRAAVLAAVNAADGPVRFDDVRGATGLDAEQLPDGAIHQIALDAGFKVES